MSRLRDERGGVLVLAAVMIPVFLLLTALVLDAGTWFTHKRQLQNRADAGAFAAGVEYAARWAACADATQKTTAEVAIDTAARRYAGDPQQAGAVFNSDVVTEQARVNVEINSSSTNFDENTSWSDTGINGIGPCDKHPADAFSPANSYWVDVKVKEVNQRTLVGAFGLDLLRNRAQARVELKTVAAGKGFLPLALPDQLIEQAEIRYYRYCGPGNPVQIGDPITLQPLGDGAGGSNDYQTVDGTTLWGPTLSNQKGGEPVGVSLTIPEEKTCGGNYIPIRAEVRVAGVEKSVIDIDASAYDGPSGCALLALQRYADCWGQLSEVRADKEDPKSEPWFHHLTVSGGLGTGQCSKDAYFAKLPSGATTCTYSGSVDVDWNGLTRDPPNGRLCKVTIGSTTVNNAGCANGTVFFGGTNNQLGRSDLSLTWICTDPDPDPNAKADDTVPCKEGANVLGGATIPVRSLFLGNRANSGLVTLVRTSQNAPSSGGLGAPIDSVDAPQGSTEDITIHPTVGLEGALYVGQHRVLRAPHCKNNTNSDNCDIDTSSPGDSQSIDCEPGGGTGGQGHDFVMFANGCRPWYDTNYYTDPAWWNSATKECPGKPNGTEPNLTAPWSPNGPGTPRRCVVKAPGFSPNVIADGIATAIGNCLPADIHNNSCSKYTCVNPNYYNPSKPGEWAVQGGKPVPPRVVFIFIIPYGAYKNTPSQGTMPVSNFAAFYVTGWEGQGGPGNPCDKDPAGPAVEDEDTDGGDIAGYFVGYAIPDAPGDPDSVCVIGQLKPCTPVLVR